MCKTWILAIVLSATLFSFSGCCDAQEKGKSWKASSTEADLVEVVNFLINNKGKEINLDGNKHIITGKEVLDVEINFLSCCDKKVCSKFVSDYGKINSAVFPIFHASVPADKIPEIDKNGEVQKIKFKTEARDIWMKVIKK